MSIVWTLKGDRLGTALAIILGTVFVFFEILSYFQVDRIDGLIGDSIRGLLTILLAYMTGKEIKSRKIIQ